MTDGCGDDTVQCVDASQGDLDILNKLVFSGKPTPKPPVGDYSSTTLGLLKYYPRTTLGL